MRNTCLEASPFDADSGALIGRDPRLIPAADLGDLPPFVGLRAIRAKFLDCVHAAAEVCKCVQTDCALWPLPATPAATVANLSGIAPAS
jgi:hypothetical protein